MAVLPWHTSVGPVIGSASSGKGFTVTLKDGEALSDPQPLVGYTLNNPELALVGTSADKEEVAVTEDVFRKVH